MEDLEDLEDAVVQDPSFKRYFEGDTTHIIYYTLVAYGLDSLELYTDHPH